MALVPVQRSVIILERVFQQSRLDTAAILQAHGIVPYRPYTHEHTDVLGAPAHRYIQPPRRVPVEHDDAGTPEDAA